MTEVVIPLRRIIRPKRGEDGLFIQPTEVGPDREIEENHNRLRAANHGHYADPWTGNTRTYDPEGNYPCGECNMAEDTECVLIDREAPIDRQAGSCEHWENTCAGDPEQYNKRVKADYGAAKNGEGFGCHRCSMQEKAVAPDSRGRDLYCKFWDCRVLSAACCGYNDAPTVSEDGAGDRASGSIKRAKTTSMIRKLVPAQVKSLGDDEVEVRMSTASLARDGHILIPQGCRLENYRANPVVLWNHDVDNPPVGRSEEIRVDSEELVSRVKFPPAGISARADEIRGLTKAGFINGISVGFDPIEGDPLDPKNPRRGMRFTDWDLLEFSFCCIPVDTEALVTSRAETNVEKAGMAEQEKSVVVKFRRALERAPKMPIFKRGLYEVSYLASVLGSLGYATDCAEWEAEAEEDKSKVPSMLGEAMKQLGEALIAMTEEEVRELLSTHEDDDGEGLEGEERAYVLAGKTPRARAWRRGVALVRAGKSISASNAEKLDQAANHYERAMKHHKALGEHHDAVGGHMDAVTSKQEKAQKAHGDLGEALQAVKNEPEKATEHIARAIRSHRVLGGAIGDMSSNQEDMKDRHQDLGDSHAALGRSIKSAQRCMRSVVEGSTTDAEDGDVKDVQTSAGTSESGGSENSRSHRRKADMTRLAEIAGTY